MNRIVSVAMVLACVAWHSASYAADQEGFKLELTPYAWLMGVDADVAAGSAEAEIDKSFSDLVDKIEVGFMGMAVASYNRWVMYGQYDYAKLSEDGQGPLGGDVEVELDNKIGTIAGGYRFGNKHTFDVLVGYRDTRLELDLSTASGERSASVGDTIVMVRPSLQLSENWRFNPTFAYAVDGDSETHYEIHPEFQYQISDSFAMRLGYRTLHYETENGTQGAPGYRAFDGDLSGILIGVGWTFPARQEPVAATPVAAPAPQPAPAPRPAPVAPPPADSDGDGVPDSRDSCPDTPRGARIDSHGCECDVTVQLMFGFDSAVLTQQDKVELDRVGQRLTEGNWVSGVAEGHTDSIGDADYNRALSERRAQAVVDYLAQRGIATSRISVVGLGETQPVADNATEEGRAANRRVVLRRTDCDAR